MKKENVLYRKNGSVALITLNRPEALNAIDASTRSGLAALLEEAEQDEEVRALVITGTGDRAFSVGQDVQELASAVRDAEDRASLQQLRWGLETENPWELLAALSKPTIAAVNGAALGSGLEIALACDIRLASSSATFGFPGVRAGVIPIHGGTQRLPRIIGRAKALEMLLTGETIDAAEALRTELVSRVVDLSELMSSAEGLAEQLSAYGPVAMQFAREAVGRGLDMTLDQGLRLEMDLYALLQTTDDRMEGLRAFRERRRPRFTGR